MKSFNSYLLGNSLKDKKIKKENEKEFFRSFYGIAKNLRRRFSFQCFPFTKGFPLYNRANAQFIK